MVVVAHGSRDPAARRALAVLLDRVRRLRPDVAVHPAHVELAEPLLDDALAALRGPAVLVPLLLADGYHVKHDLPAAAARAAPLAVTVARPLGPHPLLAAALHARLAEAGFRGAAATGRTGVVLAAAGSRDPDSAAATARTAALLTARLDGVPVLPGYACAARPTIPQAIARLTARGIHRVAVASCFTAPGRFAAEAATAAPWLVSAPLGAHPALARLVVRRYEEALSRASAHRPPRAFAGAPG
ncbi:hypothetical protein SCATT_15390 [Streptantibioticus cattleyicolor NRRL 8057 = DSM 46488]|uniref:Sirohydrochlorin ferrochelatase n=2 Tax=Kitasatosporales TaxID=85011 RepID=F8K4E7_STREN|nr:hypothetical protein SCATT_15390 [Streptantibioticus cattleyicolor NRRL 8057 = DSM 46488]MYS58589.1 sirohydrochlorin chelatase [Streptomyces sp. SID5468]CCB74257.1 conserved protein of unknown function [Streptantibioticus cattleyicolor NRRL 8057 = DSM 46488]